MTFPHKSCDDYAHWLEKGEHGSVKCSKCLHAEEDGMPKYQPCDPDNHKSCCFGNPLNKRSSPHWSDGSHGLCCRDTDTGQGPQREERTYCVQDGRMRGFRCS